MLRRKLSFSFVFLLVATVAGVVFAGLWSHPAAAQGTKYFDPEGFELSTTTPVLKYHFPKKEAKPAIYKGTWIAEAAEGVGTELVIDSAEVRLGSDDAVASFSLKKPDKDWPVGLYRLEIKADEKLVHTEKFMIR